MYYILNEWLKNEILHGMYLCELQFLFCFAFFNDHETENCFMYFMHIVVQLI